MLTTQEHSIQAADVIRHCLVLAGYTLVSLIVCMPSRQEHTTFSHSALLHCSRSVYLLQFPDPIRNRFCVLFRLRLWCHCLLLYGILCLPADAGLCTGEVRTLIHIRISVHHGVHEHAQWMEGRS